MEPTPNTDVLTPAVEAAWRCYGRTSHHSHEGIPTVSRLSRSVSTGPRTSDSELGALAPGGIACKSYNKGSRSDTRKLRWQLQSVLARPCDHPPAGAAWTSCW